MRKICLLTTLFILLLAGCSKEERIAGQQSGTWTVVLAERYVSIIMNNTELIQDTVIKGDLGYFVLKEEKKTGIGTMEVNGHSGYYEPGDVTFYPSGSAHLWATAPRTDTAMYFLWNTDEVKSNRLALFFESADVQGNLSRKNIAFTIEEISRSKQKWHYIIGTGGRYIRETLTVERK